MVRKELFDSWDIGDACPSPSPAPSPYRDFSWHPSPHLDRKRNSELRPEPLSPPPRPNNATPPHARPSGDGVSDGSISLADLHSILHNKGRPRKRSTKCVHGQYITQDDLFKKWEENNVKNLGLTNNTIRSNRISRGQAFLQRRFSTSTAYSADQKKMMDALRVTGKWPSGDVCEYAPDCSCYVPLTRCHTSHHRAVSRTSPPTTPRGPTIRRSDATTSSTCYARWASSRTTVSWRGCSPPWTAATRALCSWACSRYAPSREGLCLWVRSLMTRLNSQRPARSLHSPCSLARRSLRAL